MSTDLTPEQRQDWEGTMHFFMSAISESHNCTQWDGMLCPSLIAAVEDIKKNNLPTSRIGGIWISAATAEVLQFMADKLGYWWDHTKPYDPADYKEPTIGPGDHVSDGYMYGTVQTVENGKALVEWHIEVITGAPDTTTWIELDELELIESDPDKPD